MPNIFKRKSRPEAVPYLFPNASDLMPEPEPEPEPEPAAPEDAEAAEAAEEQPDETKDPVRYAQIQTEHILSSAQRQADKLLEEARAEAEAHRQEVYDRAKREGYEAGLAEGIARGMAQALEENARAREEHAVRLEQEIERWLERAGERLDRQLDDNVEELRDLALAIAEKVVCISLKSSTEVIGRMIQTAVDKRKRREWAHIYIAECDARRLAPVPASLAHALAALSDRVRIIPMADDESGTCIIELPDEIIDASAATQLGNIRTMLSDMPVTGRDTLFQ